MAQQQNAVDQRVTPEYLDWLESVRSRYGRGAGGNEAYNAGFKAGRLQGYSECAEICSDQSQEYHHDGNPRAMHWICEEINKKKARELNA